MKKLFFLGALAVSFIVNSQNTFPTTGNAGIGTTTPTEDLEVVGTIKTEQIKLQFDPAFMGEALSITDGGNLKFKFSTSPSSNWSSFSHFDRDNKARLSFVATEGGSSWLRLGDKTGFWVFAAQTTDEFGTFISMPKPNSRIVVGDHGNYLFDDGHKLVVKNGSAMIEGNVLTNSNVGIGTSSFTDGSDTYRLSVNGKVRANAVKVYTDWADFVFEEDYKLPTLEEVEAHIKQNGHLKDIPSAEDVEKNGIELGEMNKLLLQKVEELTLYLIQLQKEINELKNDK